MNDIIGENVLIHPVTHLGLQKSSMHIRTLHEWESLLLDHHDPSLTTPDGSTVSYRDA